MADLATLGIVIDASGAIRTTQQLNQELGRTATVATATSRTTKEQDAALRRLAESTSYYSGTLRSSYDQMLRSQGLMERFRQIQQQLRQEEEQAIRVEQELAATKEKVAVASERAGVGIRSLRSPLSTISAQLLGINPSLAQLSGLLGTLAVGSSLMVGVFAGVALLSAAYSKLTERSRNAREEADKLTKSLINQAKAQYDNTIAGQAAILMQARANAEAAKAELRRTNARAGGIGGVGGTLLGLYNGGDAAKRYADALTAVTIAEANLRKAQAGEGFNGIKFLSELAEARAKEADEELARQRKIDEAKQRYYDHLSAAEKKHYDELEKTYKFAAAEEEKAAERALKTALAILQAQSGQAATTRNNLFGAGTFSGGRSLDQATSDSVKEAIADVQRWAAELGKSNEKVSGLAKAAQIASQALEYTLVQKVGGGGAGANLGASVAKSAFTDAASKGTFGAFGSSAFGAALLNPLAAGLGAAAGGLVDLVAGAKAAREAFVAFQEEMRRSERAARIDAQGYTTLEQALEQIDADERDRLRKISEGGYSDEDFETLRMRAYEDAALKRYRTRAEYAERDRFAKESLDARELRAKGKTKEAEALDLDNRQKAEYAQAVAQGMSDEYLARLKEIQAIEKTKAALDELSKSALNMVSGYKYQGTIFRNAPARDSFPPLPPPSSPDKSGLRPKRNASSSVSGDLIVPVYLNGNEIGQAVLENFKQAAQRQYGTSARWSEIS